MNIGKMETEYSSSSSDDESTLLKKYVLSHLPLQTSIILIIIIINWGFPLQCRIP